MSWNKKNVFSIDIIVVISENGIYLSWKEESFSYYKHASQIAKINISKTFQ